MELNLEQLKKNFSTIKDIRGKVINIFQILETHLSKLKKTYAEFIQNNKQNLFVFGLDSFQFQSKLIDIEYADMKRLFLAINNRMYCEYFKLYRIIAEYVKENITDKKTLDMVNITNTFPVYKDLEPYKQYKFEMIQEIHENIVLLIYGINQFIINKQMELQAHQRKLDIGLNINNFVTTFNFNILMTKEKGMLFISYIDFFHNLHTKYLQRFAMKMNLMYNQLTHDINFDESYDTNKKDLIDDYKENNVDAELIQELKHSFDDSLSSVSNSVIVSEEKPASPVKNMRNLFKHNVHKIMNGLKSLKKVNTSENVLEEPQVISNSQMSFPPQIDTSSDERRKSIDEIFIEISKQCDEITSISRHSTPTSVGSTGKLELNIQDKEKSVIDNCEPVVDDVSSDHILIENE